MDTACEGGTDRNVAAVLCLLLGQSTCNSLLCSFAHHIATEWFRALQSLIIILGSYLALCTFWLFYRCYLVNPHSSPLRVEKSVLCVRPHLWGCASTSEFGGLALGMPWWCGSAGREGLCLLFKQHCKKETREMKGKGSRGEGRAFIRSAWLQGR